ncbi:hypothetical protein TI04_00835 [Achromatium sp. WMS2]|nr:hypothetical protein TI04_00835 [Achromatium sp. WMS2]
MLLANPGVAEVRDICTLLGAVTKIYCAVSNNSEYIMNTLVDNSTLMQYIKELLTDGKRGTLFITTDNNRSITLAFDNGVVTGISSRGLIRGARALEHLIQIERASYKYDDKVLDLPGGMPDPRDVSRILGLQADSNQPFSELTATDSFHIRSLRILSKHLRNAVGPYAVLVMDELKESLFKEITSLEDVELLVHRLALEVDGQEQIREFTDNALAELSDLYKSII